MGTLSTILIIYGVFCIFVGILKLPLIWNMKKIQIMSKMFKGSKNLQIFIIVWGILAIVIGLLI